jgi:hypothetical protein
VAGILASIKNFPVPETPHTPEQNLPAVRLYPPELSEGDEDAWFIELLAEPEPNQTAERKWSRIIIDDGHFGLPSFRYLSLASFNPIKIKDLGIYYANPEMLALANLLEHPCIKPERMKASIAGRSIKRSNKDLGRVLALGFLAERNGLYDFSAWGFEWQSALMSLFEKEWQKIAKTAGDGLRSLLESDEDFEEAHHTCINGLLSSIKPSIDELKTTGYRILGEAVEKLAEMSERSL